MRPNELDLGLELLDYPLTDSEGNASGRVDDVELAGGPGEATRVAALLTGSGVWPDRLPRGVAAALAPFTRKWVKRIGWDEVESVGESVHLGAPADELGIGVPDGRNVVWRADLDAMRLRLSRLLGSAVQTRDGRSIGRLFDIRVERMTAEPGEKIDEPWLVTGVLAGRRALLERLGVVERERDEQADVPDYFIGWGRVQEIRDDGVIVVSGGE